MKNKPMIAGIGEFLWDVLPSGKKAGGAPVNFAYHGARCGARAYAISAVGDDDNGRELIEVFDSTGVEGIFPVTPNPTGTVMVRLKDGIPDYTIIENVAWDNIPLTPEMESVAARCDAMCFGTLAQRSATSRATTRKLLSLMAPGAYRLLDMNLRQRFYGPELIAESLEAANVLKLNDEELDVIRPMFQLPVDNHDACRELICAYGLKFLILTAGASYSEVYSPQRMTRIETPRVEVVDTVGAGDAFSGAFITTLLQTGDQEFSHRRAVEVAALVCRGAGAWIPHD